MYKVVINESPIIGLCKINLENIIFDIFDEIYITEEVIKEISTKESYEKEFVKKAIKNNKIKEYCVKNKDIINKFYGKMHKGELSVIIAGLEINADFIIIDELTARNFAESLSLYPIGLIGILRIAKRKKFINEIKPYLYSLKKKGIWLSEKLINDILDIEKE